MTVLDFHIHSRFSDGNGLPDEIVAAALDRRTDIDCLALSDHNSFRGCRAFINACRISGIEGVVSCELSGSHPLYPDREFHFLINFGPDWNATVADRTAAFLPHIRSINEGITNNGYLYVNQLKARGEPDEIIERLNQVVQDTTAAYESDDPPINGIHLFRDLRQIANEKGLPHKYGVSTATELEKLLWRACGIFPEPTPAINNAFIAFQTARPLVTLAHPHKYQLSPAELEPLLIEWKRNIGLTALELHYGGDIQTDYLPLAESLGLFVSAGSDTHAMWQRSNPTGQAAELPVLGGIWEPQTQELLARFRCGINSF